MNKAGRVSVTAFIRKKEGRDVGITGDRMH
jgi:hypothetical protein